MLFETDADQKGSSPWPCPGFSTRPLDLRLICKGRAEKNNENKIKRKSESTGNNCLRAWLRVQEPTGACSSKLLRDTSVCWAQKLRRRVDTARASLEWMLGLRGRGMVGGGGGEAGKERKKKEDRPRGREKGRDRKEAMERKKKGRIGRQTEEGWKKEARKRGENPPESPATRGTKGAARTCAVSKQAVSHPPRPATEQPHAGAHRGGHVLPKPKLHRLAAPRGCRTTHKNTPEKTTLLEQPRVQRMQKKGPLGSSRARWSGFRRFHTIMVHQIHVT